MEAPGEGRTVAILQTGRLGDLWFTLPLCHHLHTRGVRVEVVYDAACGSPFLFAPYVTPRPMSVKRVLPGDRWWGRFISEALIELAWLRMLKREGRIVVWNQLYPFRWLSGVLRRRPYPEYWYRHYPAINFRRAVTTLDVKPGDRILVFRHSRSLNMAEDAAYFAWIDRNLDRVVEATGMRPLVVAYGEQPDHGRYETWRGTMAGYQELIAGCGVVFGMSTSAHVLGQLLGKPTVVLYGRYQFVVNTIGAETACVRNPDELTSDQVAEIRQAVVVERS